MKMKWVLVLAMSVLVSVSTARADSFFDGFESGSMTPNWYKSPASWASLMNVQTEVLDSDNVQIATPHSGQYLAHQVLSYSVVWPQVQHDFSTVSTGQATFWVNPLAFNDNYIFSVAVLGNHSEKVVFMNFDKQIRILGYDANGTATNFTLSGGLITTGWHEVKFDVQATGTTVYYDGAPVPGGFVPYLVDAASLMMGTAWGSASCAYDDVSFVVPEPMTLILMGLGAIGFIRRR